MNARPSDYALLVTLSAIYGASFLLIKISVHDVPVYTLVAARLFIGAAILWVIMKAVGQVFPSGRRIWFWIFISALFGNAIPWALITWGQGRVDAGQTAILMATMPFATILLAHIFTDDEKLNSWKIIGVFIGTIGVVVLIGYDKLLSLGGDTLREYAIALAAVFYGINAIITKQLLGYPRRAMAAALMIVSFLIVAPFALVLEQPWNINPSWQAMMAVITLGIFPTALGTLMIFAIVKRQGASFFSLINFLVPVFGVLWSFLFLSERLSINALVALVLILLGVGLARLNPNRLQTIENRGALEKGNQTS